MMVARAKTKPEYADRGKTVGLQHLSIGSVVDPRSPHQRHTLLPPRQGSRRVHDQCKNKTRPRSRSVAETHDELCKVNFKNDPRFPRESERQRVCIAAYKIIAESLLGQTVRFERFRGGGAVAAWRNGVISLNIDVDYLWDDPLGEESVGTILHECTHKYVSGHAVAFWEMLGRLGGKLAGWVGQNPQQWADLRDRLYGNGKA